MSEMRRNDNKEQLKLLDLFCGAGGCSMGYYQAGFEIVGVDDKPQKNYPFEFHQADAMTYPLKGFDVIHASPPCQKWSVAGEVHRRAGKKYVDLLTPIRERLHKTPVPWIIENVVGSPIAPVITLCGLMFSLKVFRHRHFECSHLLFCPEHPSHIGKRIGEGYYSVAGGAGRWKTWGTVKRDVSKGTIAEWRDAMGIDWMIGKELRQAIPPAYTKFIGKQLIQIIQNGKKA